MNNKKYWKLIFRFLKEKDYFRVLCKQLLNYSAVYDKQYPNLSYFEHISHSVLISWFRTYGIPMSQGHVKDIHRVDIIKDFSEKDYLEFEKEYLKRKG